jgi:hypothetical protein
MRLIRASFRFAILPLHLFMQYASHCVQHPRTTHDVADNTSIEGGSRATTPRSAPPPLDTDLSKCCDTSDIHVAFDGWLSITRPAVAAWAPEHDGFFQATARCARRRAACRRPCGSKAYENVARFNINVCCYRRRIFLFLAHSIVR